MYTKEFEFPAKTVFANNSDNVSSTKWSFTIIVSWIFDLLSQQPEFENQIFVFFGGTPTSFYVYQFYETLGLTQCLLNLD